MRTSVPGSAPPAPCHVVGNPQDAHDAAVESLAAAGRRVVALGRLSGSADDVAAAHVTAARELAESAESSAVVSVGETTVRLPEHHQTGGRATHLALAMAVRMDAEESLVDRYSSAVIATDGEDGDRGNAGTLFRHEHMERARDLELDPVRAVEQCASYTVAWAAETISERTDLTNVQDLRIVLLEPVHDDRERWDERHGVEGFRRDGSPSAFLSEVADRLPRAGRALDIACGDGGDAVFLAERGLHVTAVDISPVALAKVRALAEARGVADRVKTVEHDLRRGARGLPIPEDGYDVVTMIHYRDRELLRALRGVVRRDGWLVVETATTENVARGLPAPPARWLAMKHELFYFGGSDLVTRLYREDEIDGMVRAQLLAQNPQPWDYPDDDEEDEDDGDAE